MYYINNKECYYYYVLNTYNYNAKKWKIGYKFSIN